VINPRKILLIFFIQILLCASIFAVEINTLQMPFTRISKDNISSSITKGTIYHSPGKTILIIEKPIDQWVLIDTINTIYYYPDKAEAISISAKNSTKISFLEDILNILDESYGLEDVSLQNTSNEIINDTLVTTWEPEEENTGFVYELSFYDNKLVKNEVINEIIDFSLTTFYYDYLKFNNYFLPTRLVSIKNSEELVSTDIYEYEYFKINVELQAEIMEFVLPQNTKITKRQW